MYIWLQLAAGICSSIGKTLFSAFSSVEDIYYCNDFSFLPENKKHFIKKLENKDMSEAFEIYKKCKEMHISLTGFFDDDFPKKLRNIKCPPVCLYYIGTLKDFDRTPCVSVVGSRKCSEYGQNISESFAYNFAKSGLNVISGLAKGIDVWANRGALRAEGYTIGVLGTPIDKIYPSENADDFKNLYEKGLVISELYPGCKSTRADFPNRNRLISGLADAVLVVEAGEHSGALITARDAVLQGKKLYAVPSRVGGGSAGTNNLIKDGASIATDPTDVISGITLDFPHGSEYYKPSLTARLMSYGNGKSENITDGEVPEENFTEPDNESTVSSENISEKREETEPLSDEEMCSDIEKYLSETEPLTPDEIAAKANRSVSDVLAELTVLEIEGTAESVSGNRYIKNKKRP